MSVRTPRRRFATPFVLTLAAIPACTVQSGPAPQGPTQPQDAEHARGPKPTNPPRPDDGAPPLAPEQPDGTPVANPPRPVDTRQTGVNDQVKGTANTGSTTVAQQASPGPRPGPAKPRGYREWTVTRRGDKCEAMVKVYCPEGAMCNPPPPTKYACPKYVDDGGRLDIIQHTEKSECFVDWGDVSCPPQATCNPPPPAKVACPK